MCINIFSPEMILTALFASKKIYKFTASASLANTPRCDLGGGKPQFQKGLQFQNFTVYFSFFLFFFFLFQNQLHVDSTSIATNFLKRNHYNNN